jgi:prepilin-type N-terminal cleavage/methylation domain-containing protein
MINKRQHGFTLIELVVAMGVFLSLFLIVIVNFRSGESINELKLETQKIASDVRKVQTLALTGSNFKSIAIGAGGYGIRFLENDNDYILFSDVNADGVYLAEDDTLLETRSLVVDINSLQIEGGYDELHIVFEPYSSSILIYTINGSNPPELRSESTSIYMIHDRVVGKTGVVGVTPVSGKIDFAIE